MLKKSRKPWDATESLPLPKINTKMPPRTKSVEMNKILTNSETHLHHCLCESRGFNTGRRSHRRLSIKKVFLKYLQNWQDFFLSVLRNFLEHFFYRTLPGDCFWWIGLMVKNFNSVSLIFLNSQLYHALPRVMTIILVEQRTLFNEKTWLNSKSQTLFWHYFRGSLAEVFKVVFIIFSKPTGKYLCKSLSVGISESLCHFWESCPPSNFYFGFFYKLFQAAALQ